MFGQRCSKCRTQNRVNARFCQSCRATLEISAATRVCPRCQTVNCADAKFCAHCRHLFAPRASLSPILVVGVAVSGVFVLAMLCIVILFATKFVRVETKVASTTNTPHSRRARLQLSRRKPRPPARPRARRSPRLRFPRRPQLPRSIRSIAPNARRCRLWCRSPRAPVIIASAREPS